MQQLGLNNAVNQSNNAATPPKIGYWKRQFQVQGNSKQKVYDWIFGVILPVICFAFDPIVFKGNGFGGTAFFSNYKPFAYLLSFACVMAMAAWLIFGEKLKWLNGFLAGLFFFGGLISLAVGIVLFPFSVMGLIVLIGALGFTPLFTAVIFLRNAFRALHASKGFLAKEVRIYAFAFGLIFSASLTWTINSEIKKSLRWIEIGNPQIAYDESRKLRYVAPLVNFDNLVLIYHQLPRESEKSKMIAEIYKELTGEDIKYREIRVMD